MTGATNIIATAPQLERCGKVSPALCDGEDMEQIRDDPMIRKAMETGYGLPVDAEPDTEDDFDPNEPVFITDEGEMNRAKVIEYMCDYIKSNTLDAADAFGIEVRWRN